MCPVNHDGWLPLLHETADAVAAAMRGVTDFGPSGQRSGQYALDLVADGAALSTLRRAGVSIMSEESGFERGRLDAVVVVDPIDGSTNASRGIPYFATSLAVVEGGSVTAALVVNQATGETYTASLGGGAWCDGRRLAASGCEVPGRALVALNGVPPRHLGWAQCRMFGAAALDLCRVAAGLIDAYVDCDTEAHGPWDYLGGYLICREAGAGVVDAFDRDLITVDHTHRRTPVAAATPELLAWFAAARRPPTPPTPPTPPAPTP